MPKVCYEIPDRNISLVQNGVDSFTVNYGKQSKKGLNYGRAALELGSAIMHSLSCDGIVDNREKGE